MHQSCRLAKVRVARIVKDQVVLIDKYEILVKLRKLLSRNSQNTNCCFLNPKHASCVTESENKMASLYPEPMQGVPDIGSLESSDRALRLLLSAGESHGSKPACLSL